jgi:glyoxylase-like metal-dependent hydrolase (beta-lactamase superfamily II)
MTSILRQISDKLWTGELSTRIENPMMQMMGLEPVQDGLAFVSSFANVSALSTSEGLVLVDTGSFLLARQIHGALREWTDHRLHTAVFTHGHADHVFGVTAFEEEAAHKGWAAPTVVAHEALAARFDRYRYTRGYNSIINERQFRVPGLEWPSEYRYPDVTYRDTEVLTIGGERLELYHGKGETDDGTWVWLPERKVLCTGDMFIWASPNCGNPQKAQRYPREWAQALRKMAALGAETLLPGHGPPIWGADRVEQALTETATLLESIVEQTVQRMNAGMRLDQIIGEVRAPAALLERPYLRPIYDEPEFVVRNLWRLYGGWYDGNPAHLKPARDKALGAEVAALAGGAATLVARAQALSEAGEHALACHLAEWAGQAAPKDVEVASARAAIYARRSEAEGSLMAQSIYLQASKPSS